MLTETLALKDAPPELSTSGTVGRKEPKYFEVFGDTLAENVFLRNLAVALAGACLVLTVGLVYTSSKPPLVVRVDGLHAPVAIPDLGQTAFVTAPEVSNFAQHFERSLLGWDLYSLDDDIDRALSMMTPEAAGTMKRYLDGLRVTQLVTMHALRTKVVIAQITIEKDEPHAVWVKVRGTRLAQSYDGKAYRTETIFEDSIVAKKVARTMKTPWGLLVADWSENVFNRTDTPQ